MTSKTFDFHYYAKDLLRIIGECAAAAFLSEAAHRTLEENGEDRFMRVSEIYVQRHLAHARIPIDTLKYSDDIIYLA
jgi:hypothetical protein